MSEHRTFTAWSLVGFDGQFPYDDQHDGSNPKGRVKIVGGRALYDAVMFNSGGWAENVKLARLEADSRGLREVSRYVDPDTLLEFVPDKEA